MTNKRFKFVSLMNIIVAISLLLNVILISNVLSYKNFINEEITRSIRLIESDLTNAQEILEEIINFKKVDELQYRRIYSMFNDFEYGYKHCLYNYYYEFESEHKDFSEINLLFDMNDYLLKLGKERQLSLYEVKKDNTVMIHLTENEVDNFKSIYKKNSEYLNVIDKYKVRIHNVKKDNWVKMASNI
mgnify:FL=1